VEFSLGDSGGREASGVILGSHKVEKQEIELGLEGCQAGESRKFKLKMGGCLTQK